MKKILIIEDDDVLRTQLAQIFHFEGFETLEAQNGKDGVASALRHAPDLIVCDIMMPELDGFGVLQALRDQPGTGMIPFIFLTALVTTSNRRLGMEQGADDYITKPYDPAALVGSVRRRLAKRDRQIEESRLRAEEVSLAVAASVPREIMDTLDHIATVTNLLALKYEADDPQVSTMRRAVVQESARLRRMMRRLHLYAQLPWLYANRFELATSGPDVSADEIVDRVARDLCQGWNRERDLEIALEPARVPLREEYLTLLVEELVDNACKFSPPGAPIKVSGGGPSGSWSLAVESRGEGLDAGQLARIGAFKQFWSGGQKPRGLGLGLALTQGIARLHGCEFSLQSHAGTTTASVLIPLET